MSAGLISQLKAVVRKVQELSVKVEALENA